MKNHLHNDIWLYSIVVAVLGLTVMASMVRAIVLTLSREFTPEVCVAVALGSAAIGGLAGLLALSPMNR
jgi:hypothetical protein